MEWLGARIRRALNADVRGASGASYLFTATSVREGLAAWQGWRSAAMTTKLDFSEAACTGYGR